MLIALMAASAASPGTAGAQIAGPICPQPINAGGVTPASVLNPALALQQPQGGLSGLPQAAQPLVSATLGQNDAGYHFASARESLSIVNRAQALDAQFTAEGMEVNAAQQHWRLALRGYGYGERLQPVAAASPRSQANRVEYRRGSLVEWYVNGPLGIEQGFTLHHRPRQLRDTKGQALTLSLALEGDLQPSLDSARDGGSPTRPTQLTLRDANGRPVLRYTGITARDANGRELPAWLELRQNELRLRVADIGAQYPLVVDPLFQNALLVIGQDGSIYGATPAFGGGGPIDIFSTLGSSLAVSGDGRTVVVISTHTLPAKDLQFGPYGARVSVFSYGSSGWYAGPVNLLSSGETYPSYLDPDSVRALGFLGATSVAVNCSGSTIVVGANPVACGQTSCVHSGAAYVFVKPAGGWATFPNPDTTPAAKLTASDGASTLGMSVAISGDGGTAVAGASSNASGAAYVFLRPPTGWASANESAKLTASDGNVRLGFSVATSSDGGTIVAGAASQSSGGGGYVFTKPSSGWTSGSETVKLATSDNAGGLGWSVATNGSTTVAGAPFTTVGSNVAQGAAYIFATPVGGWASVAGTTVTESAKLSASNGTAFANFGSSVAVTVNNKSLFRQTEVVLVGAPLANFGQGAVYAFAKPFRGGWVATSSFFDKLVAFDAAAFGYPLSVGLDLTTVAVAAPGAYYSPGFNQFNGPNQIGPSGGAVYAFTGVSSTSLSAGSLNFGNLGLGSTATRTVTLMNNGSQPLNLVPLSASFAPSPGTVDLRFSHSPVLPQDFQQSFTFTSTSNCAAASPLAPGASCTETVSLTPTTTGPQSAMLFFIDDSDGVVCGTGTGSQFPCNTQFVQLGGNVIITAGTTTSITSVNPSPSMAGGAVTVGYSVIPQAGDVQPSGAVAVTASTGEMCVGLAPSGSCSLIFQTAGMRTIQAAYFGDQNVGGSTSSPVPENVAAIACISDLSGRGTAGMFGRPDRIDLTWTAYSGAVAYNVLRGTSPGGEDAVPIGTTTTPAYTDTKGLVRGTTYYYVVRPIASSAAVCGPVCASNEVAVLAP